MNPKPFASLNHFTVPVAIFTSSFMFSSDEDPPLRLTHFALDNSLNNGLWAGSPFRTSERTTRPKAPQGRSVGVCTPIRAASVADSAWTDGPGSPRAKPGSDPRSGRPPRGGRAAPGARFDLDARRPSYASRGLHRRRRCGHADRVGSRSLHFVDGDEPLPSRHLRQVIDYIEAHLARISRS